MFRWPLLADGIAEHTERSGIGGIMANVQQLLDDSVAAKEYLIPETEADFRHS